MRQKTDFRNPGWAATLALGACLVALAAGPASASPIIDGRFDAGEGYTLGRPLNFAVEGVSTIVSGGRLWTHQDATTGDVSVAFIQPLTLVDNTYGANSIGWGSAAPSGKKHNFKDLVGSDKAEFAFTDGAGNTVLSITMDYLSETSKGSGVYDCLGVTGGDGKVHVGSASDVLDANSSLDYNFNALGFALTTDSPATDANYAPNLSFPGWEFEVIYELKVAGSLFAANGYGDVTIPVAHDSPNKIGKNKTYPEVPEPATMSLLAIAAAPVLLRKRRRA